MSKAKSTFSEAIFGFGSPVSIAVFRIFVGLFSLLNFLMTAVSFSAWYTETGLYPTWMAQRWSEGIPRFSPLIFVQDARLMAVIYGVISLSALTTMLGLWSRASSIMLFVGTVALHHRTPDLLSSADTLLRMWCFYIMIAPSGAALSLDRMIAIRKGNAAIVPKEVSLWPQRLIQLQLSIVYFTTVWWKWMGTMWRDGTASYYPAQLHEFDRFPVPEFVNSQFMVMVTTYGTLIIELAVAFLAFAKPLRKWVLLSGLLLHGYIEYSMNIPLFGYVITSSYICFYSGEEITAWARRLSEKYPNLRKVFFRGESLAKEGEGSVVQSSA